MVSHRSDKANARLASQGNWGRAKIKMTWKHSVEWKGSASFGSKPHKMKKLHERPMLPTETDPRGHRFTMMIF